MVGAVTLADDLSARLGDAVATNVPAASLTTYRVGGPIEVVVRARAEADLAAIAEVLAERRPPLLVVGRGSNLLFADAGFPGVVVVLTGEFEQLSISDEHVRAGGGVALPVLARRSAADGRSGLEFFVGIPGTVGGAVRMNAGGHGRETVDVLVRARIVDLYAEARTLDPVELALSYRHSNLDAASVVSWAEFRVHSDDPAACEARIDEIVRWRREHQPGGSNAGSVFRNPPNDSAGRLIEAAGAQAMRIGGVQVSDKHANFFQADTGANAADVVALIHAVQRRVRDHSGVDLVPEVRLVGFSES